VNDSGDQQEREGPETPFSREERAALAAWQAPPAPAGFAEGVLAAWQAQQQGPARPAVSGRPHPFRGLAVAAVALMLLGGFFSVRSFVVGGDSAGGDPAAGFTAQDGGPGPEVRAPQPEGGIERQPS
jgi:hypothetical protein